MTGVPQSVMNEIAAMPGRSASRGKHGFVVAEAKSGESKTVLELFAGTGRLSSAVARLLDQHGWDIQVECFEILRSKAEDLLDKVRIVPKCDKNIKKNIKKQKNIRKQIMPMF